MSVSAECQTLRSNRSNRSISRKEEKRYLDLKKNRVKERGSCMLVLFCFQERETWLYFEDKREE